MSNINTIIPRMFDVRYLCVLAADYFGWLWFVDKQILRDYLSGNLNESSFDSKLNALRQFVFHISDTRQMREREITEASALSRKLYGYYYKESSFDRMMECGRFYITILWKTDHMRKAIQELDELDKIYKYKIAVKDPVMNILLEYSSLFILKASILYNLSDTEVSDTSTLLYRSEATSILKRTIAELNELRAADSSTDSKGYRRFDELITICTRTLDKNTQLKRKYKHPF